MGVAPANLLPLLVARAKQRAVGIALADVHATGEADLAVHHQDLAVVTVVRLPGAAQLEGVDRVEGLQLNACCAQALEKSIRCAQCADRVVDDACLHTGLLALHQQIGKTQAYGVLVEDIGFQVDAAGGTLDGRLHGGHGLWSVKQQRDLVASDHGAFDAGRGATVSAHGGAGVKQQGEQYQCGGLEAGHAGKCLAKGGRPSVRYPTHSPHTAPKRAGAR